MPVVIAASCGDSGPHGAATAPSPIQELDCLSVASLTPRDGLAGDSQAMEELDEVTKEYVRLCADHPKFDEKIAKKTIEVGDRLVQLAGGWLPAVRSLRA